MSAASKSDNLPAADMLYDTPRCNTYMTTAKRAGDLEEPEYAYLDEVKELKVSNNVAYAASITLRAQNVYSTPDEPLKQEEDEIAEKARSKRGLSYRNTLCSLLCGLFVLVSLGLASSALAIALWSFGTTERECDCSAMESHVTFRLNSFEQTLQETAQKLAQSREEVRMLSELVAEYYQNATALRTPEKQDEGVSPSTNITRVVHDCNTSVESVCTVDPIVGTCQTPCVPEKTQPLSIATNFQCIRLESDEQNPLVGVLDVAGGEVLCLCYVLSIDGLQRTHPVDCALRVTRCSLANIT